MVIFGRRSLMRHQGLGLCRILQGFAALELALCCACSGGAAGAGPADGGAGAPGLPAEAAGAC